MKHFQPYELVDKKTYENLGDDSLTLFTPDILIALDNVREYFNRPITVNNWHEGGQFQWRGYRTPEKAKELGAPHSEHAKGNAFDFDVEGFTAEQIRHQILADKDNPLLSKIMRLEANTSWTHMDCKQGVERIYLFYA